MCVAREGREGKGKVKSQREPLLNYAITGTHHTDTQGHTAAHSTDHYCRLDTAAEEASNQDKKRGKELEMERSKGRRNEKEESPSTNQNSQRTNKARESE